MPIRTAISLAIALFFLAYVPFAAEQTNSKGMILNSEGAFPGYTLFAPLMSTTTYLIDMQGRVVNRWESDYEPGQSAYLLENGNLLRTANEGGESNSTFHGGGSGGKVQEFSWDGELVWEFTYSNDEHMLHHDIEPLPNGNILMIAWERIGPREVADAGRNTKRISDEGLWAETVIEVKPTGKRSGKVVWKWSVWDHLVQDRKRSLANYGKITDHPGRVNINILDWTEQLFQQDKKKLEALGYLSPSKNKKNKISPDWLHFNAVGYNAKLDQIVVSVLGFNEFWIIDHAISTKEAAGPKGDILYRWGNPLAYGAGTPEDQQLFAQHDAHWIPEGHEGAGHILIFNNGRDRLGGSHSSIDEIVPPVDERGRYSRADDSAFGPAKPTWTYAAEDKTSFYSTHISGAQRLPNGNTFICSGENGTFFEVTAEGQMVWKYVNPVQGERRPPPGMKRSDGGGPPPGMMRSDGSGPPPPGMMRSDGSGPPPAGMKRPEGNEPPLAGMRPDARGDQGKRMRGKPPEGDMKKRQGRPRSNNCVFRACRYGKDYAAFKGKKLEPGQTLEALLSSKKKKGLKATEPAMKPPMIKRDASTTNQNASTQDRETTAHDGFVILDRTEFEKVVSLDAKVTMLAGGMKFTEGPVWIKEEGYLLFSDIPSDEIKKWENGKLSTFRKPSRNTNGNLLDEKSRLLSCEHGSRTVTRTLESGEVETLVDLYEGKKLNSPNDIAVRSDGMIWFTDPPYGLKDRERELDSNYVFRFDPDSKKLKAVVSDFDRPNGICLSPDETKLYIADSGRNAHIRVFDVAEDGSLNKGKVFCKIDSGAPDGIRCDLEGRVFSSAGDGVHIFMPSGELIGKILVPERPSNLCFGGTKGNTLFITARTSLYTIPLKEKSLK